MITNSGKYYLYRHIRLDTNKVFYIGIGTKNKTDLKYGYYSRAKSKDNRNKWWFAINNKTKYKIDILLESNNYEFIVQKEKEFIKLYGRKNLNLGTLCNLTDGGEGLNGYVCSKETKDKISKARKGLPFTGKVSKIYKYSLKGDLIEEIKNIRQFCLKNNYRDSNLLKCAKGYIKTSYGYIWKLEKFEKVKAQTIHKFDDKFKLDVFVYNNKNEFIGIFKNSELIKMGFLQSKISQCCLNKRHTHKNHVFSYKNLSRKEIIDKFYPFKIIIQMDLKGNFIKEWVNPKEIIKNENNIKQLRNIYMCCNNKRNKAHGSKWKYKN